LLTFTGNDDRYWVERLVARWVDINGCDTDPVVEHLGSGVARKSYVNCLADVVFYDIETMAHAWPLHEAIGPGAHLVAQYAEVDYLDETLRFFSDHPLP
jgi:poly(3-hydroxybutyrate) depolymerase